MKNMDSMKLRFILMGCILTALGVILTITRGFSTSLAGIIVVGVVLAIVGMVWKPRKKAEVTRVQAD